MSISPLKFSKKKPWNYPGRKGDKYGIKKTRLSRVGISVNIYFSSPR
jgi:hypothetical protein